MADVSRAAKSFTPKQGQYLAFIHVYTRLHRLQYTRWCSHSNAQASSDDSRASLAASKCSLIRNAYQSYFDPRFNLSKSLCSGTSAGITFRMALPWQSQVSVALAYVSRTTQRGLFIG